MDAAALDAWFAARVASNQFSGVALVTSRGRELYSFAGGLAVRGHRVPVHRSTRFRVASISKLPVAAAALRLVERGRLHLHAPIVDVLPPDWRPAALTEQHSLHHLLSHTSGLTNYHDVDAKTWDSFTSCWDRVAPQLVRRPADLLPLFADGPLRFEPGSKHEYADVNYIVVGMVIEAVTGSSFADVVRDEVLVPAGMGDSDFAANDSDPQRMAVGYFASDDEPFDAWRTNVFSVPAAGLPDGGLITTVDDLDALMRAIRTGTIVRPDTLALMTAPQIPPSDDLEQYGYGLELVVEDGAVTMYGHNGHDPGVSALVTHWLHHDTTIIVLCNHDRGSWVPTQHLGEVLGLRDLRE